MTPLLVVIGKPMDTPVLIWCSPFNLLNSWVQRLSTGLHLEYFASQTIIEAGASPEGIYLIIKGKVEEYGGRLSVTCTISQFSDGDCSVPWRYW